MSDMTVENNGGWLKKLNTEKSVEAAFYKYEGWDKISDDPYNVPYVHMENVWGQGKSSHDLDVEFDDIATDSFYSRDWTKSGLPFCGDGEPYWSGFWFKKKVDAEKFIELYGGVGNWMPNYQDFLKECKRKRGDLN